MALRRLVKLRSALKPFATSETVWISERSIPRVIHETPWQGSPFWLRNYTATTSSAMNSPFIATTFPSLSNRHPWILTFRPLTTRSHSEDEKSKNKDGAGKKSLMIEDEEEYGSITDKIPEKPMTAAEGVSYTLIILAAFAILGMCLWAFVSNYIWDPVEYACFNVTLDKLRTDPRVTVRVGEVIKGYGSDSMNRRQRHVIRNRQYRDANGTEHTQIQFNIKGSGGVGIVYADMFQDEFKKWQYTYLYVDIPEQGRNASQRLAIVTPPILNVQSSP